MADLATVDRLELAWRPLTIVERPRAEYYLGVASRRIRRRWPNVDERIASEDLDSDDVQDVVVHMVLGVLDGPPIRRAKSWSEAAGPMSRSVTLEAGKADLIAFEDWMVEVFEGTAPSAGPVFSFPPSGRYESISLWSEGTS